MMENLRYMLKQYKPENSLYFGHRFDRGFLREGYMAGGGYVLSKKTLSNFIKELPINPEWYHPDSAEDAEMGELLD